MASELVAVLTRAIPVDGYKTDTITRVLSGGESVIDMMDWAEYWCKGNTTLIKLELTRSDGKWDKLIPVSHE